MKCHFARASRALGFALALQGKAQAETSLPSAHEFSFSCASLSAYKATEVEARSRVEAQLAGREAMKVRFVCSPSGLKVELESRPPDVVFHEVRGETSGRPLEVALVDLFVQALQSYPTTTPPSTAAADPSRLRDESARSSPAASAGALLVEPETPASAPKEQKPDRSATARVGARSKPRSSTPRGPKRPFARLTWDAFASYESLGSEAVGTLGFGTAGLLGLAERWRVGPMVRVGWGLGMPDQLSLTAWNVALIGEYSPLEWLSLGLGPQASIHLAQKEEPLATGSAHTLWGGCASANLSFGSPRYAFRAGLMLSVLSSERIVRLGGQELMTIPPLSLEAHLGGRFGFFLE